MAYPTNPVINGIVSTASARTRSNSAFIRELWTDEIIAAYKASLIMPQLVVKMDFNGKKGDTIHLPRPVRGAASVKTPGALVTLNAPQAERRQYLIDDWYEYSALYDDLMSLQAQDGYRVFITDDAGYQLAKTIDTALHTTARSLNGAGTTPTDIAGSALASAKAGTPVSGALVTWSASGSGNGSTISEEGLRLLIRELDDNDVPSMGRTLVIPPVEKQKILGIPRFTEQAFVGEGSSIRNGRLGQLYGVDVYVSTNCGSVAASDTTAYRVALLMQREALVLFEQQAPRVQVQYKQEYLSDLFTADVVFDTGILRAEAGIPIVVPA